MSPGDERGRPRSGNRATACEDSGSKSLSSTMPRPADRGTVTRVRGIVVADLTDLHPWDYWQDEIFQARSRLYALAQAPAAADVVIRVGRFRPWADMFAGEAVSHLGSITIESDDAEQVRRWTRALREVIG